MDLADGSKDPFLHTSDCTDPPVFDFKGDDVLPQYDLQPMRRSGSMNSRSNSSPWLEQGSTNRRHRSSSLAGVGSPVYLTGELFSSRKEPDMDSYNSTIVSAVERIMKKYADNILRVLEGMSGRLSQLESITQDLEQSVAALKVSVDEYREEADARIRTLNNHVVEMHRAVQILRDKQDIVAVHAELAKLQSSKAEAVIEDSSARGNQTVDTLHHQQQQLPMPVVPNITQPTSSTVSVSYQQGGLPLNQSVAQLQQLPTSPLPHQYIAVQAQDQRQQNLQLHVQSQSELQQAPQGRIQQAFSQTQQTQLQQQTVQPQAPGLAVQQLQQQAELLLLQHQMQHQTPNALSHMEQVRFEVVPQQMQMPLPQQAPGQQLPQGPPTSTQFIEAQQTMPAQIAVQPAQLQQTSSGHLQVHHLPPNQIMLQTSVQLPPVQETLHAHVPPNQRSAHVPPNQRSFQQQSGVQHEGQTFVPLSTDTPLHLPFGQGAYVAESSYGAANFGTQQQLPQGPSEFMPQNYHQRNRPSAAPSTGSQSPYESTTTNWKGRNTPPVANAHRHLPLAQLVHSEPSSGGGSLPPKNSPLDEVVEKVVGMGFPMDRVRSVIRRLTEKGQSVDLNVVLDTLMNGAKENQLQRGWQVR